MLTQRQFSLYCILLLCMHECGTIFIVANISMATPFLTNAINALRFTLLRPAQMQIYVNLLIISKQVYKKLDRHLNV